MQFVTAEDFLRPRPMPSEDVPCPEFGPDAAIRIRRLRADEREAFEDREEKRRDALPEGQKHHGFRAAIVAATATNEAGGDMFTPDQAAAMAAGDGAILARLAAAAVRVNGLGKDADEEREKN